MRTSSSTRSVLVLGGAGFIGSNWVSRLLDTTDARVNVFDNLSRNGVQHNLRQLQSLWGRSGRLQFTCADVRDSSAVERAVSGATEIYHFAAQVAVTTSMVDPRQDFETNLTGTFNVLEAARVSGNRPFLLFTSTNKVYGEIVSRSLEKTQTRYQFVGGGGINESESIDFHSPYGCSKGAADQYVRDYARVFNIPAVVFRMSCIAGPRQFGNEDQGWVAHFLYSALRQVPVFVYGDGLQVRDVLCVQDLMRAFEAVATHLPECQGKIYNIGGGPRNTTSLIELIDEIKHLTGHAVEYEVRPMRAGDQLVYVTDYGKMHSDTAWQPTMSVRQTLESIYDWWRRNPELFSPVGELARLPHLSSGLPVSA
jgi:CDP-paratose 2-epimerase